MAEFEIWNLEGNNFSFEGINFQRISDYEEVIKNRSIYEHCVTFRALANDNLTVKPIIKTGGLIEVVHDLCILLSLAQSRQIFFNYYEINGQNGFIPNVYKNPHGTEIISYYKLGEYLKTAVTKIRQTNWIQQTGFTPSVYFIIEQYADEITEFEFIKAWICLEILANAHYSKKYEIKRKNLDSIPIAKKVTEMKADYALDFITYELLKEYKKLRNGLMHHGIYGINNDIEQHRVGELSIRLTYTIQLTLIELLGCSNYVRDLSGMIVWITRRNLNKGVTLAQTI